MRRAELIFICILATAFTASSAATAQPAGQVAVNAQQAQRLGIVTAPLRQASQVDVVELPARIVPNTRDRGTIFAPFAGVVTAVHALPGQRVKAGDAIMSIASRDYAASASGLMQAQADARAAKAALTRQQTLVNEGLGAPADLEMAQARARQAAAVVAEHSRFSGAATGGAGGAYVIRSQGAGEIARVDVRPGETVTEMASVAILLGGGELWAEIQLPARLIGQVKKDDAAEYREDAIGRVVSTSAAINPATRSSTVLATVPAGLGARIGEITNVRLRRATPGANAAIVEAPATAVIRIDGADTVFVAGQTGFVPTAVRVLGRSSNSVVLEGALKPGTLVATRGLTELKALALQAGK